MKKCLKRYVVKIGNNKDNVVTADVAQLEYSNNKCYASAFTHTHTHTHIYIDVLRP